MTLYEDDFCPDPEPVPVDGSIETLDAIANAYEDDSEEQDAELQAWAQARLQQARDAMGELMGELVAARQVEREKAGVK